MLAVPDYYFIQVVIGDLRGHFFCFSFFTFVLPWSLFFFTLRLLLPLNSFSFWFLFFQCSSVLGLLNFGLWGLLIDFHRRSGCLKGLLSADSDWRVLGIVNPQPKSNLIVMVCSISSCSFPFTQFVLIACHGWYGFTFWGAIVDLDVAEALICFSLHLTPLSYYFFFLHLGCFGVLRVRWLSDH